MPSTEEQLQAIAERNKRVEADKAWERSWTRRLCVAGMTYIVACVFLWLINDPHFTANALVPTLGYTLSTLSLPWMKQAWLQSQANGEL